jgi:hypothetical protein
VYFSHIWHVTENLFCTTRKSSVSTGFTEQNMPNWCILCYNGSLVICTVVNLNTAIFIPHLVLYREYVHFYDFYNLWLSPAQSQSHMRLTVSRSVPFDSYGLIFVGRPLWREVGSVFCICCWLLPGRSFSGSVTKQAQCQFHHNLINLSQ